jgi:hypothetical protein
MARLPNCEQAIPDIFKHEDYCLNPHRSRGKHKARVFRESLDVTRSDASWLRDSLLTAVKNAEAIELGQTLSGRAGVSARLSRDRAGISW